MRWRIDEILLDIGKSFDILVGTFTLEGNGREVCTPLMLVLLNFILLEEPENEKIPRTEWHFASPRYSRLNSSQAPFKHPLNPEKNGHDLLWCWCIEWTDQKG